jgi:tetratricopeptide (TPR) repeat protein
MYGEAESQFEQLRRSGTHPIDVARGRSEVLRAQGRPAAAERLIDQALQDNSDDPSLRRELGYIAYDRGALDRAAEIFGELIERDPCSITDRRWLAASLRQAKKYSQAQAVLDAAPEMNHHGLDLERGWVAYAEGDYASAADHFRAAKAHGAQPDSFVPPLVKVLLRMDRADDAQAEAADVRLTSSVAAARADIQVHIGCPRDAIELMLKLGTQLDENGLTQLVTLLLDAERDEEARDVFRKWLREKSYGDKDPPESASPSIVGIWIELACRKPNLESSKLAGQVESTLERYARPDSVPATVAASAIRTMRKVDKTKAKRIAKEHAGRQLAPVSVLIESAITSFLLFHDYQSALQELDRAIQLQPENERALQWRCRSMWRLGQWPQLEAYLDDGNSSIKRSAPLQVELGWLRLAQCEYPKAADAFLEACRLDRSSQEALFGRVTALRKLQRWQEAETVLKKWEDQWPDSSRRRLAAAILALDREDFHRSAQLFQQVDGVPGLLGQASVLIQQRREHEACGKLEDAENKDPDRPGPKIALATLLAQENQDESRREDENRREERRQRADKLCCDAMGRGAESDAAALGCRAHLAAAQGNLRLAESFLDEAQQCNPYGGHTVALASVLIGMHRIDEAVTMLNERLKAYPHDSSAYFQLHRALHARGDAKAALGALRSGFALATGPGNDPLAVHLAYELEEQGYSAEAEQLLRTRLAGGGPAKDDHLRLGLAWILLTRGERAQSPALLEEAATQASQVLAHPDLASATANPEQIKLDALKCRGTAYYKLAEHERNPGERARLAALARHDQRKQRRNPKEKAPRGSRWPVFLTAGLDTGLRVVVLLAALAFTIVLWVLHSRNQTAWTTTMVVSLTPLLLAIVLLTALLPQLQTLKLAGLEAQTRQQPEVQLPTSPSVVLPHVGVQDVTEFAAAATENFIDAEGIPTLVIHALAVYISHLPEPPTPP